MHIGDLSAHVGFINLNIGNKPGFLLIFKSLAYPVSEKPCRFLRYFKIPGEFHTGYTLSNPPARELQ